MLSQGGVCLLELALSWRVTCALGIPKLSVGRMLRVGGSSNVLRPLEQAESPSCGREGGKMFSWLSFLVITWDCFCLGSGVFSHSQ